MKLWQKEGKVGESIVEVFTVGTDQKLDLVLAKFDVLGSLAHTEMLATIGLLTVTEFELIQKELKTILVEIESGDFKIESGIEDIHSQIEWMLTQRIGEAGKKIHSGRSRNDQVLTDIKLYLKSELKVIADLVNDLFHTLIQLSEAHKNDLLPGYTHFQLAMPSSFGLWFGAYAESLVDDMEMLVAAYNICNKNPLGSGAGYGSSFPLDRTLTTELLDFKSLNTNVVYAQMTRGKTERSVATGISGIASTLSKLAYDVCLYMNQNFGFVSFPDHLTTGSSIMPHKKNPDVFELVRAKCNRIQALPNELTLLTNNLPSGYHRDMQLTKEILFPGLEELKSCLMITKFMLEHIQVKSDVLENECYRDLFSVEAVNEMVLKGVPFRDAYKLVGKAIEEGTFEPQTNLHHTHIGSIGNLQNKAIVNAMMALQNSLK